MIQSGLGGRIDLYCRFMRSSERPRNGLHLRSLEPERADRRMLSLIYQQSEIYAREGVELEGSTLADGWEELVRCSCRWCGSSRCADWK